MSSMEEISRAKSESLVSKCSSQPSSVTDHTESNCALQRRTEVKVQCTVDDVHRTGAKCVKGGVQDCKAPGLGYISHNWSVTYQTWQRGPYVLQ